MFSSTINNQSSSLPVNAHQTTPKNETLQKIAKIALLLGLGLMFFLPVLGVAAIAISFYSLRQLTWINSVSGGEYLGSLAKVGNIEKLRFLVKMLGANPNTLDRRGNTPLHWAAYAGENECLRYLISVGGDVNKKGEEGLTPLHHAVEGLHEMAVEVLLNAGADRNIKNEDMPAKSPGEQVMERLEEMRRDASTDRYNTNDPRSRQERLDACGRIWDRFMNNCEAIEFRLSSH